LAKVFLFGAGASCEYRGVYGPLFMDTTFFPALRQAWEAWMRGGAPIQLTPWNPKGPTVPSEPHHYDGGPRRWPELDTVVRGQGVAGDCLEALVKVVGEVGDARRGAA
jgi:hypothetical protein